MNDDSRSRDPRSRRQFLRSMALGAGAAAGAPILLSASERRSAGQLRQRRRIPASDRIGLAIAGPIAIEQAATPVRP